MGIIIMMIISDSDNDDDSVHGPHGQSRGHRKLTRQRREIFPDYEKRVQNRVFGETEEDEEKEEEENSDNSNLDKVKHFIFSGQVDTFGIQHELRLEDEGKPLSSSSTTSLTSKRRRSYIPPSGTDQLLQCKHSTLCITSLTNQKALMSIGAQ